MAYAERNPTLEKIVESIISDNTVINAKKQYELAVVNKRYQYLQWWQPSLNVSNNLAYPYQSDEFDNKLTSNTASLDFAIPLPTGSIAGLGASYSLARDLLETSTIEKQDWGFSQDLQLSISLSQSLNPWWLHSRNNPYNRMALIQQRLTKNDYNGIIKDMLFSSMSAYIRLRKIERNSIHIKEMLKMYDALLDSYQKMYTSGGVSWRDYESIRAEKWEYESNLFSLENDRLSVQGDLYKLTGAVIENTSREPLVEPDNALFMQVFTDIQKQELNSLNEKSIILQKENLEMGRLIDGQTNAPKIKLSWGTLYKLPVKPDGSLWDAWTDDDNWNDNIKNNWSLGVILDLSSLLSPVNRRNTLQYNMENRILEELYKSNETAKQKDISLYKMTIKALEEQINRLSIIIENENVRVMEDEEQKNRGVITANDFMQEQLAYNEKLTLLNNLNDDLWFYNFVMSFY
jgi:hypothetical protein